MTDVKEKEFNAMMEKDKADDNANVLKQLKAFSDVEGGDVMLTNFYGMAVNNGWGDDAVKLCLDASKRVAKSLEASAKS